MEDRDVGRLAAFTDGIIVVAMTLLVLDIHLPRPADGVDDATLWKMLAEIGPKYFGYVLSFLVVGMFWMGHVRKFRRFARVDGGTVWLTLMFLLVIGVIPFVTSVLSENGGRVAVTLYASTMAAASLLLVMLGAHGSRKGLYAEGSAREHRHGQLRSRLTFGVFRPRSRWRNTTPTSPSSAGCC